MHIAQLQDALTCSHEQHRNAVADWQAHQESHKSCLEQAQQETYLAQVYTLHLCHFIPVTCLAVLHVI